MLQGGQMKHSLVIYTLSVLFIGFFLSYTNYIREYKKEKEYEHHYNRITQAVFKQECMNDRELENKLSEYFLEAMSEIDFKVIHYQCNPKIMRVELLVDKYKFDRTMIEEMIE